MKKKILFWVEVGGWREQGASPLQPRRLSWYRAAGLLLLWLHSVMGLGLSCASPQNFWDARWPGPGSPRGTEPRVGSAGPRAVVPVPLVLRHPTKQGWAQCVPQAPQHVVPMQELMGRA